MSYDYRAKAYAMAGEINKKLVDAVATQLHYNESLHMHELGTEDEQHGRCGYCWLRAGRAVRVLAAADAIKVPGTATS